MAYFVFRLDDWYAECATRNTDRLPLPDFHPDWRFLMEKMYPCEAAES